MWVRERLCWVLTVSNHFLSTLPFPPICCIFSMYFASYEVLSISEKMFAKCTETSQSQFEYFENKTIASFHLFCNYICRDVTVVSGPLFLLHMPELYWKKTGGWIVPWLIMVQLCYDIICRHIRCTLYLYATTLTHTLWILWRRSHMTRRK